MGGGGGNIPIGAIPDQWKPYGADVYKAAGGTSNITYGQPGQTQQGGFNQGQQNYIQNQGKLPTSFGGGALSGAQQNFFNTKGYLPPGVTGDKIGQQYYGPQQQQQPANRGPIMGDIGFGQNPNLPMNDPRNRGSSGGNPFGLGGGSPLPPQLAGNNKAPGQPG